MPDLPRCHWALRDPMMRRYHDTEWGVPVHDGRALWEKLMLDGFQAGLAWSVILRKREALRRAFEGFEPQRVAQFDEADIQRLLQDASIIRSRSKIQATIGNARAYLAMAAVGESFADWCWAWVGGRPLIGASPAVTQSPLSRELSVALKKRGFTFVGPVIVYAWMEAVGMINDHEPSCYRQAQLATGTLCRS
jgi:DNA-3-methyladenine glycosylase I